MKAALPVWRGRIAPVFDVAHRVRLITADGGRVVSESAQSLPEGDPRLKLVMLSETGVNVLICGAISRPVRAMAAAYGMEVTPFIAGDVQEVVLAWLNGSLKNGGFAMPGCYRRQRCRGSWKRTRS